MTDEYNMRDSLAGLVSSYQEVLYANFNRKLLICKENGLLMCRELLGNGLAWAQMILAANDMPPDLRARFADNHRLTTAVLALAMTPNAPDAAGIKDCLADALFVLGMVDKNNRIDAGETGKAWSGRFVVEEVRRVLGGA